MPPDFSLATTPRRRLADDLRAAIDGGEIELRFQPQVAMATNRIEAVEVLARWRHARLGELGADKLFAAAARAALLPALSRHIQAASLAETARWPSALGALGLALNVTASDLAAAMFAADLLAKATEHGLDPARLTVEVTEHELIADLPRAAKQLTQLRAAGVRVALDDFGTGYSSIAYLKALPLDYLKLDSGLSRDVLGTAREQVVVRHVITMARELGLGVIAEGVETEAHRAALAAAGGTHYQGYLCAPPLDSAGLSALVFGIVT